MPSGPIDRRSFLAGAATAASTAAQNANRPPQPNILHIMSDQQQWATIASRSECRTPNLNRLASQGLLFERSYTPSAVCCPARAMLLSGAFHWHNGVYNQIHSNPSVHRDMNRDVVLYSQRLRDAGYRLGYTGKWHASYLRSPLDFGYHEVAGVAGCDPALLRNVDHNPDRVPTGGTLRRTVTRRMTWPGSQPFDMWGYREGAVESTPEWRLAEQTIRMMNRFAKGAQPWLLEAQFVQPHDPYLPLKQYLDRYDARAIPVPASFSDTFTGKPGFHRRESETWGAVTADDVRQSRAHYYAYIEQLDEQIGRILDALDKTGQQDRTIVVFTTDHGDCVGAHRMWIKGWIPYEECYRVPLIVRWPGRIPAGSKTDRLVQTHDLAHTYVTAASAEKLPYADGAALQPLFEDPRAANWRDHILCAYYGGEFLYTQRMAITSRFKYVFNGFDYDELYDLERDPGELHNAVNDPEYARWTGDMRARMYELMAQYHDPFGDSPEKYSSEPARPDRYCAERYLPRGKRA
jgi:arylsulfatase A-like enzyme